MSQALQVLKYDTGQFYHPHHDTITESIYSMTGPRMLTAFVYYNTPEGGGNTRFVQLKHENGSYIEVGNFLYKK